MFCLMLKKKDKMVSCGVLGCTNQADKNSNIITFVTIIIMLLQLYGSIFRTMACLMPEAYSKHWSKVMSHIEHSPV